MEASELARLYYDIVHREYNTRMCQRDTILLVYLAASGTVFGVGVGAARPIAFLLVIPILALGCAILVAHHTLIIGSIFEYCYFELYSRLQNNQIPDDLPAFERSKVMEKTRKSTIVLRWVGHSIILAAPCTAALVLNWSGFSKLLTPASGVWWFGVVLTACAIGVITKVNWDRIRLFEEARAREQQDFPALRS